MPVRGDHPPAGPKRIGANRSGSRFRWARPTSNGPAAVTLISYGRSVLRSLAAATALQDQGVNAEVVDLRTLVPLDIETIVESVRRTRRAVVVHDAVQFAGRAEIVATLQRSASASLRLRSSASAHGSSPLLQPQGSKLRSTRRRRGSSSRATDTGRGGCPWVTSSFASLGSRSRCSRQAHRVACAGRSACRGGHADLQRAAKVEQEIEAGASGTVQWTGEVGTTYDIGVEIGVIKT